MRGWPPWGPMSFQQSAPFAESPSALLPDALQAEKLKQAESAVEERNRYVARLEARLLELARMEGRRAADGSHQGGQQRRGMAGLACTAGATAAAPRRNCAFAAAVPHGASPSLADITPASLRTKLEGGSTPAGSPGLSCQSVLLGSPSPCAYDVGVDALAGLGSPALRQPAGPHGEHSLGLAAGAWPPSPRGRLEKAFDGLTLSMAGVSIGGGGEDNTPLRCQGTSSLNPLFSELCEAAAEPGGSPGASGDRQAGGVHGEGLLQCGSFYENELFQISSPSPERAQHQGKARDREVAGVAAAVLPAVLPGSRRGSPRPGSTAGECWTKCWQDPRQREGKGELLAQREPRGLPRPPAALLAAARQQAAARRVSSSGAADAAAAAAVAAAELPPRCPSQAFGCVADLLEALTPQPAPPAVTQGPEPGPLPHPLPAGASARAVAALAAAEARTPGPLAARTGTDAFEQQLRAAVENFHAASAEKERAASGGQPPRPPPSQERQASRRTLEARQHCDCGPLAPGASPKLSALKRGRLNRAADQQQQYARRHGLRHN